MITCDNIREIIKHISKKDLKRIKNTKKEYWITPPELYKSLDQEFNFDFDPCPYQCYID